MSEAAGSGALDAVMLAFEGTALPGDVATRLATAPSAGITIFRFANVASPGQLRELTASIARASRRPPLIGADQEGGQFLALGDGTTPFAGNMALGAAGSTELAERVGRATGLECLALGVNVAYAPVCDLAVNPHNPAIGIRSFGDDPQAVASLVAAMVRGLQSAGVAAGLKHFPGLGDVADDSHHELPTLDRSREELEARELIPFRAGIAAGARIVMSAHLAVPSLTGDATLPATLSRRVMTGLLRDELGFDGVSITDALDMGAIDQATIGTGAVAALRAGIDLLMTAPDPAARGRIEAGLTDAEERGLLSPADAARSAARVDVLHGWLGGFVQPDLSIVGSAAHLALADELAERSITLVRDDDGLLPLRLAPGARILAIQPRPVDQTPADTTSTVAPGLASALRGRFAAVDEIVVSHAPSPREIAAARDAARGPGVDAVVVGTSAAFLEPAQAALVEAVLSAGRPTVTVALRTPFDLAAYPAARCHVAAYGILPPTLRALAATVAGAAPFQGRLPAAIPGLYPTGHGLVADAAGASAR
jgi:beta-N-acetylhexosaminidase